MGWHGRDGFILVAVLAVMALLAGLVGAVSLLVRSTVHSALAGSDDLVLTALVRAGVELAGYELYGMRLPFAQIDTQQIRLNEGVVTLFVTDESGKIDLNGASAPLLAGAYAATGLSTLAPDSFAARVIDWRDKDDKRSRGGAEAADYAAAGLDYRPQNDSFRSVEDLQWLLGLSQADASVLAPSFTVYNPDGKLNVMTATREVLLALPDVNPPTADQILLLRKQKAEAAAQTLAAMLQRQAEFIKFLPGPSYRVRIEARRADLRVKSVEVVLAASPSNDPLYYVVGWTE